MQQTKRRPTDLARSTNYNIQRRLPQEKQKCGNQAYIGSAKQKWFIYIKPTKSQMREVPKRRGAKQQRLWYAANRKMTNGSSAQHQLQYTKQKLIQEQQKCGNQAHIGSAKQKWFICIKPTKSQCERCQIAEVLACNQLKDEEPIQRTALTTIQKKRLLQEKQKCGNQAHIASAKQKKFISTKPTKCQIGDVPNSSAKQQRFWYEANRKTTT